jgi:hypothetical protein
MNPRKQLPRIAGLCKIVIRPDIETHDAVNVITARTQHHNPHVHPARAQLPT